MCGIFASINSSLSPDLIEHYFQTIQHRGPEFSQLVSIPDNIYFGFHRLGIINPTNIIANQPFECDGMYLICNGEIYNYKNLESQFSQTLDENTSDCRVILDIFGSEGIYKTVSALDGEFAFVLYDSNTHTFHVARDAFGVRPLFYGMVEPNGEYYFASELKAIPRHCHTRMPFPPNSILTIDCNTMEYVWNHQYFKYTSIQANPCDYQYIRINSILTNAVAKRLMSDRTIGCLLSGGLDSSLITSIVSRCIPLDQLHTFSIGMKGGLDLQWAHMVVEHLGLKNHHSIEFTPDEALAIIPAVIESIESYDITTVRASVPQFLLAKYIKENMRQ